MKAIISKVWQLMKYSEDPWLLASKLKVEEEKTKLESDRSSSSQLM